VRPQKKAGGVAQLVQRLPMKCEGPSSNPSTAKKSEKESRAALLFHDITISNKTTSNI
jgi:hypothetical protein